MKTDQQNKIEEAIEIIDAKAKEFGLDYYDTEFLIANEELMDQLSTYVLPVRFHHWTFGKEYQQIKTLKKYGLSGSIYECVINSDPAYGFLSDSNNLTEMKVVIAHVFGHVDFFKNNFLFKETNKHMAIDCGLHARKIADYMSQYGEEKVERWIDACLSIARHCELAISFHPQRKWMDEVQLEEMPDNLSVNDEFDFLFSKEKMKKIEEWRAHKNKKSPIMEKDILLFLMHNKFSDLEAWQKDIMGIIRDEMRYFIPNLQTKIMNEGWSSYWHQKIIEELDAESDFLSEDDEDWYMYYAAMNARVLSPGQRGNINPYLLGSKIFERIYEKWENPTPEEQKQLNISGGEGTDKIFEVRETMADSSFIRNYLDENIADALDLFMFELIDDTWTIVETEKWEKCRDQLAQNLSEAYIPTIYVVDDDYKNERQLYLMHDYKGDEIEEESLRKTLGHIAYLWKRPVILRTAAHLTYEARITKDGNHRMHKGEERIIYVEHDGKNVVIEVEHGPILPVRQAAEEYNDAKWRIKLFEEKTKQELLDN